RVVEDDLPDARRQRVVERAGELAQGASALVAVERVVAAGDVVLRDTALAGSRDAHDEDDLRGGLRAAAAGPRRTRAVKQCQIAFVQAELRGAGGGLRSLRASGAGDGDDHRRELEQPGERDLGRGGPVP